MTPRTPLIFAFGLALLTACETDGNTPRVQGAGGVTSKQDATDLALGLVTGKTGAEVFVAPDFTRRAPTKVVVLPFDYPANEVEIGLRREAEREMTQTFRNVFSALPYLDIEAASLNDAVLRAGLAPGVAVPADKRAALAQAVGADAMIVGTVTAYEKVLAGLYGQLAAGADVQLISVADGRQLWRGRHTVRKHHGGLPLSPIDAVTTLIGTALEVTDKARIAALDELMRALVAEVPIAAGAARAPSTSFLAARHSGAGKILKAGDELRLAVALSREAPVKAQIGKDIVVPLERAAASGEAKDQGVLYEGRYRFKPGEDRTRELVAFVAFDEAGRPIEYLDPYAPLTVDTTPPDQPSELRARFAENKTRVSWTGAKASDIAAYEVWRSATPRSGFAKIGETEFDFFVDDKPLAGVGFYQVIARDRAGNSAEPTAAVEGRRIPPGPTAVPATLVQDTVWYAEGSPYVLDKAVSVATGATLRIEPGTTIRALQASALAVDGRILAEGTAAQPITWEGPERARWFGVSVRNAGQGQGRDSVFAFNRFTGADVALSIVAASPQVRDSSFTRSDVGLRIAGAESEPRLRANLLRNNRVGIVLDAADVEITGHVVRFNTEAGVEIVGASPQIFGNDLSDNADGALKVRDQTRRGIFDAGRNWWGSTEADAVRSMIKGSAAFEPLLDAAPPAGKPMAALKKAAPPAAAPAAASAQPADPAQMLQTLQSAYKLMDEGKSQDALAGLRAIAPQAPRNADLHYRIALLEFQNGQAAEAKASIARAIAVNPFAPHFHLSQGMILKQLGDAAGAEASFKKVLELNPRDKSAAKMLGAGS